jgi:hypothetical protein
MQNVAITDRAAIEQKWQGESVVSTLGYRDKAMCELCVGVLTGPNLRHEFAPYADHIIDSVCYLSDILNSPLDDDKAPLNVE